jgi:S-adenosylmethionine:tRNA ribosyltransferase-isomerase
VSFNLHKRLDARNWKAFARPAKRLAVSDRLALGDDGSITGVVLDKGESGEVTISFDRAGAALDELIKAHGAMPLPPYIEAKRGVEDRDRTDYQTVFADRDGAVAAPTAGLHFTPDLLARLAAKGVGLERLTLHVGAGTFLPVKVEDTADHKMHAEWGELTSEVAARLRAVKARGGRIVAVGTTSLRLLETAARPTGTIEPFCGDTDIFITPGYRFTAVDVLMTNFHLPRSTLFMLVSAFAGTEAMRAGYGHAIATGYRFYSYGDASLLFRA